MGYSAITTGKKASGEVVSVSGAYILALVISTKLQPILASSGVDISVDILTGIVISGMLSAYRAVTNYIKNRGKK